MPSTVRVTVWNEYRHEKENEKIAAIYPDGMHGAIAATLNAADGIEARCATLDEPEHGLTEEVLAETDVLTWWGHRAHNDVDDAIVDRVQKHVLAGMGIIILHSGHMSKIFRRLMGTNCTLKWREVGEREVIWCTRAGHPIAEGVPDPIILEQTEMYGEFFDIPEPDETVYISSFAGGEVFRSGCTWRRGAGKVFYFRPGHETYPLFHNPTIQKVLVNAVRWAAPAGERHDTSLCDRVDMGWFEQK